MDNEEKFVCVCLRGRDNGQTLTSTSIKFCTHVLGCKISVEFVNRQVAYTISKWWATLHIEKEEVSLERQIIFENQTK